MIDTLETVEQLEKEGFTKQQAKILTKVLNQKEKNVATKNDIMSLKSDIQYIDEKFTQKFNHVDERFHHIDERFDHIDEKFTQKFNHIDERFNLVNDKFNSLKWFIGIAFAIIGLLMTVISLIK